MKIYGDTMFKHGVASKNLKSSAAKGEIKTYIQSVFRLKKISPLNILDNKL